MSDGPTDKDVLVKARELIDAGWTQRTYHRSYHMQIQPNQWVEFHEYCSLGAIKTALNDGEWTIMWSHEKKAEFDRLVGKVARFVPGLHDELAFDTVAGFNDDVAKDKREVLAVFDQAIAAEDQA